MSMTRGARVRPGRHPGPRAAAVGVAAAMLVATAACGGSSKPSSSSTTTSPPPATSSPASSPATTSPPSTASTAPSPSAAGPSDPAAATAQIKQNWQAFFDPKTPVADKEKFLQNGSSLAPLLQGFASDPRVGKVSATVSNVAFTSPTTATVTYSLSLSGTVVVPNATGQAVLENGTWKVADSTLCGLLALTGNTKLPGCS